MRLFVAASLDDAVREAAARLLEECRERAVRLAPRARITWAVPDRMHVTIRFIGPVGDGSAAAIRDVLTLPMRLPPFECTVAGAGAFPGRGQPRVVWAGVTAGSAQFVALEDEVSRRLAAVGLPREDRPFNPHVTLARVRDADGLRTDRLLDGLTSITLGRLDVRSVTLFESRLSPQGATYLPLLETPLGGVSQADR
jgi:2'-5' RNA ligase